MALRAVGPGETRALPYWRTTHLPKAVRATVPGWPLDFVRRGTPRCTVSGSAAVDTKKVNTSRKSKRGLRGVNGVPFAKRPKRIHLRRSLGDSPTISLWRIQLVEPGEGVVVSSDEVIFLSDL